MVANSPLPNSQDPNLTMVKMPTDAIDIYAKIKIVNSVVELEMIATWLAMPSGLVVRKSLGRVRMRSSVTDSRVGTVSIGIADNGRSVPVFFTDASASEIYTPNSRWWRSRIWTSCVRLKSSPIKILLMTRLILVIGIPKLTSPISKTTNSIVSSAGLVISDHLFEIVLANIH